MCINTSNFLTCSHPGWERRGSLTPPALPALSRLRGGDLGPGEVRAPPGRARSCALLRGRPAATSPPARDRARRGRSAVGLFAALFGFYLPFFCCCCCFPRRLGSTWRFGSSGDSLLPPNEAGDSGWAPQIKLAWPWLHPVWISHLPNDFMSRTQRVNFLLTFPIAAVSILL